MLGFITAAAVGRRVSPIAAVATAVGFRTAAVVLALGSVKC